MFGNQKSPDYINDILSEESLNSFGIFNPTKVRTLISNIRQQKMLSEIDQMAIAAILSTQLLYKMFIKDPIKANVDCLNNYRMINECKAL